MLIIMNTNKDMSQKESEKEEAKKNFPIFIFFLFFFLSRKHLASIDFESEMLILSLAFSALYTSGPYI